MSDLVKRIPAKSHRLEAPLTAHLALYLFEGAAVMALLLLLRDGLPAGPWPVPNLDLGIWLQALPGLELLHTIPYRFVTGLGQSVTLEPGLALLCQLEDAAGGPLWWRYLLTLCIESA